MATTATRLSDHPIHLGLGATAEIELQFTGAMEWYAGYGERHGADGAEGRLVTVHQFDSDWDVWEMHPVTADVAGRVSALFITAGEGTRHRPR